MVRLSLKLLAHNILLKITKELRESRREIIYLARFLSVVLLISLHVVLCIYFGGFFCALSCLIACALPFLFLYLSLLVRLFRSSGMWCLRMWGLQLIVWVWGCGVWGCCVSLAGKLFLWRVSRLLSCLLVYVSSFVFILECFLCAVLFVSLRVVLFVYLLFVFCEPRREVVRDVRGVLQHQGQRLRRRVPLLWFRGCGLFCCSFTIMTFCVFICFVVYCYVYMLLLLATCAAPATCLIRPHLLSTASLV